MIDNCDSDSDSTSDTDTDTDCNPARNMAAIDLLTLMKPPPMLAPQFEAAFRLHVRFHETDPDAFARIAPQVRAIAASGESVLASAMIAFANLSGHFAGRAPLKPVPECREAQ